MARWEPLLEEVVRERYRRLVVFATMVTAAPAAAEDVVQDALVATFASRARFSTVAQAESYVRRAIASRWLDQVRRHGSERRALERLAARPEPDPGDPGDALLGADVATALAALPARERACVVLRHLEDVSVRDTAALLRLSEGAVKRYVSDGVAALNAALGTTVTPHAPVTTTDEERTVRRA